MRPVQIAKLAAGLHVVLVAAAAYYTLRINNRAALSDISMRDASVMAGMALLPVVSTWLGLRLARSEAARWILAAGQTVASLAFAATFVAVLRSVEPMAPLLFVLMSSWLAGGLTILLLVVWLAGRGGR